jgi:hypothetical protein
MPHHTSYQQLSTQQNVFVVEDEYLGPRRIASPDAVFEEILAVATQLVHPGNSPQGYDGLSRNTRKYEEWRN